jgi:TfoX/Sxy family transcriptional regulator of competence genes
MAFDPGLAERVREALAARTDVSERRMFGGLAFLLDGHMAVGLVGGVLMARVGPARHADALAQPHVRPMDFTGRPMTGYVYIDPEGIADDEALAAWVSACAAFVDTLPRKGPGAAGRISAKRPRAP